MREQTNIGSDHINHKPFLLVLFIANKILNRHLTDVGSKSMVDRRSCGSGRAAQHEGRDGEGKRKTKEDRWMEGKESKRQKRREGGKKEGGRVVLLDSPPLGLISFCILCCEPAG